MWFFLRMCRVLQASLLGTPLSSFSGRLPTWGSMRSGDIWPLLMSVRPTSANAGSVWPTAQVTDTNTGRLTKSEVYLNSTGYLKRRKTGWKSAVTVQLSEAVVVWSTPTKQDGANNAGPSQFNRNSQPLNTQVAWATPQTFDANNINRSPKALARAKTIGGCSNLREQVTGQLNPDWVETLMGYPPDWTDISGPPAPARRSSIGNRCVQRSAKTSGRIGSRRWATPSSRKLSSRLRPPLWSGLIRSRKQVRRKK